MVAFTFNTSRLFDLEPTRHFRKALTKHSGVAGAAGESVDTQLLGSRDLDAFTHARLWRNPCGFAARFNYLSLRYNTPLYGWIDQHFGLSRAEFVVIYSLGIMDGLTASEIAISTAFPKNTLSRAVNRFARLGLIQRIAGEADRRQQHLRLTPKGRALLEQAMPRFVGLEAEMLAPLTLVEQETLSALMAKVVLAMFHSSTGEKLARSVPPS